MNGPLLGRGSSRGSAGRPAPSPCRSRRSAGRRCGSSGRPRPRRGARAARSRSLRPTCRRSGRTRAGHRSPPSARGARRSPPPVCSSGARRTRPPRPRSPAATRLDRPRRRRSRPPPPAGPRRPRRAATPRRARAGRPCRRTRRRCRSRPAVRSRRPWHRAPARWPHASPAGPRDRTTGRPAGSPERSVAARLRGPGPAHRVGGSAGRPGSRRREMAVADRDAHEAWPGAGERTIELNLLGGFALTSARGAVPLPPTAQRVLAFLALGERPLARGYVSGTLWPIALRRARPRACGPPSGGSSRRTRI